MIKAKWIISELVAKQSDNGQMLCGKKRNKSMAKKNATHC